MNRPESPTPTRPHGFGVQRTTQTSLRSTPASVFEKLLRAYQTGGFTYADFRAELKLLLATSPSPTTELLEILRRRELIEPLQEHAHAEVFSLLNDAIERAAAEAAAAAEA